VKDAIDVGYRHIDGAYYYENEREVGAAIAEKIKEGVVKRKDMFVTSKLWNTFHDPAVVEKMCRKSLSEFGLDYLDLYLIHFPFGHKDGDILLPRDENGIIQYSDHDYVAVWKAMERLVKKGLVKSIGVSNFNKEQLERILEVSSIKPVVNQVECHPYLSQVKLAAWMEKQGILLTAYSPLGSPDRPTVKSEDPVLLEDPRLKPLAEKYNKSVAQILIRYQIDRGFSVIPKSVKKERLRQNLDVFDFSISPEDIKLLNAMDCNGRYIKMIGVGHTHKYYPFNAEF